MSTIVSIVVKRTKWTAWPPHLIGLYKENKQAGQKVYTVVGCPQRCGVHRRGFYCILHIVKSASYEQKAFSVGLPNKHSFE